MNVTTAQLVFTSMKTNVSLLVQSDTSLTPPPTLVTHVTTLVPLVLVLLMIVVSPVDSDHTGTNSNVNIHVQPDSMLISMI
jgi:hypothetical protein